MITVISGTNRPKNNSILVARNYVKKIEDQGIDSVLLNLEDVPDSFYFSSPYGETPSSFEQILDKTILSSTHIVFVVPEYNGGFPGILKLFIDTLPPSIWNGKKAALVGVATGRSGNQRGLDHLTGVLHYLKMEVLSAKPLLSSIHKFLTANGELKNDEYNALLEDQLEKFRSF
jgi:NAD(P)H-dependent FMN reductase